ncbi:hypothetical protein PAXRUDRAFT_153368, partial [Paxillus rubicundulus Ve08.2h10]
DPAAWKAIHDFAATDMTLPQAEKRVQEILGAHYNNADWQLAFNVVMDAKGDSSAATAAVEKLRHAATDKIQ